MTRQPCDQGPVKTSAMAVGRVGDPQGAARRIGDVEPILRNIDADAKGGCSERKDQLKRAGDELPWRTFRKKGKVLWRRIVTRGGPGLPFALKTEKRQDDRSRLLANSCSIQNRSRRPARHSYRKRNAAKEQPANTYDPGDRGHPTFPGLLRFARNDGGPIKSRSHNRPAFPRISEASSRTKWRDGREENHRAGRTHDNRAARKTSAPER